MADFDEDRARDAVIDLFSALTEGTISDDAEAIELTRLHNAIECVQLSNLRLPRGYDNCDLSLSDPFVDAYYGGTAYYLVIEEALIQSARDHMDDVDINAVVIIVEYEAPEYSDDECDAWGSVDAAFFRSAADAQNYMNDEFTDASINLLRAHATSFADLVRGIPLPLEGRADFRDIVDGLRRSVQAHRKVAVPA
jgi:hypothetical protein